MAKTQTVTQAPDDAVELKRHGQFYFMVRRFCRNKAAVVALAFVILLIIAAIFCDYLTPMTTRSRT